MPYQPKICTACDKKQEAYHNVRKCKKCGKETLVIFNRHADTSMRSLQKENENLRAEVNVLRQRMGIGIKYREWEKGPKT